MRADTSATLDPALATRPPTEADFDAVLALIVACDVADYGAPDYTAEDLRDDWRGLDLATDVRLILAGEAVVGCGGEGNRDRARRGGVVYTHPRHHGRGIGTVLTRFVEARAREKARASGREGSTIEFHVPTVNEAALALTANEGFQPVRYMLRMAIAMTVPPPEPAWPPGVTLRAFDNTAARAVHEAIEESFADHWGQEPRAFEEFRRRAIESESHDPSLWFVAWDGERVAGVTLCNLSRDVGWVATVGVRRPWRRHGLALALLHHAFGEFWRRDQHNVALGVDSESLTGATRVYERAGMHASRRYALMSKRL